MAGKGPPDGTADGESGTARKPNPTVSLCVSHDPCGTPYSVRMKYVVSHTKAQTTDLAVKKASFAFSLAHPPRNSFDLLAVRRRR